MDHVLREGLYMDRIRTYLASWNKGSELYMFIFKVNALRFTLVMARKHERQTGVVNDLARLDQVWRTYSSRQWKGCYQTNAKQSLGKIKCFRGEEG